MTGTDFVALFALFALVALLGLLGLANGRRAHA